MGEFKLGEYLSESLAALLSVSQEGFDEFVCESHVDAVDPIYQRRLDQLCDDYREGRNTNLSALRNIGYLGTGHPYCDLIRSQLLVVRMNRGRSLDKRGNELLPELLRDV